MAAVSPGRTVVATLDRRWPLGALNLHALFQDLDTQSSVIPVGLTEVLAGAHPAATVVDEPGDPTRNAQVESAVEAIAAESQFATVAVDPTAVTAPRRLALLALLAVSWLRGTDDWAGQVTAFLADSHTLLVRCTSWRAAISSSVPGRPTSPSPSATPSTFRSSST